VDRHQLEEMIRQIEADPMLIRSEGDVLSVAIKQSRRTFDVIDDLDR